MNITDPIWANTVQVDNENDLQEAINTANSTEVATVIELQNSITLTNSLTVPYGTTIMLKSFNNDYNITLSGGNNNFRLISVDGGSGDTYLYLDFLTLENANTDGDGGAIYSGDCNANLFVVLNGLARINNCSANNGGAIALCKGYVEMRASSLISNCRATGNGGGIYLTSKADGVDNILYVNSEISYCSANNGGAIYVESDDLITLISPIISNNEALNNGGAVYATSLRITTCKIDYNKALNGGAIYLKGEASIADTSMLRGNSALKDGGAVYIESNPNAKLNTATEVNFINNRAGQNGGAIWVARDKLWDLIIGVATFFSFNSAINSVAQRDPADDEVYYTNISEEVSWTEPFTQGYNNYDIAYFEEPLFPCEAVTAYQRADICLPVNVKPFADVGVITAKCCGVATITPGTNVCEGTIDNNCNFTVSQSICIEVPVQFGAEVTPGETHVATSYEECTDCE